MCGIVAYKGNKYVGEIGLECLKRVEYRGYDSWGLCLKENSSFKVFKKVGKISQVDFKDLNLKKGNIIILHSRWATHGGVTEKNAHPHLSNNKKIAVVHNGIVENYQELKKELIKKNFKFESETDTEVIPNLIQDFMDKGLNFEESVKKSFKNLKGSSAFVVMHKDYNTLIGIRKGSPLVVGVKDKEYFLASDVPAFLEHTNNVVYLEDDEMAVINDGLKFYNLKENKEIKKDIKKINWTLDQAKKGDYNHFMLKEICEQRFTIKRAIEQPLGLIEKVTEKIKNASGIFFVGCGTSYHACVTASYFFSKIAKEHVNVCLASEFSNYKDFLTDKTLVVAVSQSGETADVIDAIKAAKEKKSKVISIVNVMGSTITRISDLTIMMNAGPEICVLSTKSYTSQLAILLLLAYSVSGKLDEGKNFIENSLKNIDELIDNNLTNLKKLADILKDKKDIFLIGRDLAYPSALEGALKIKEVSYIHAEGFAGAELKHGTIALIEKDTPTIVLSTNDTRDLILSNATEIKSRGGYIIGVDSKKNEVFDYFIEVPEVSHVAPLLNIIPIQILSYYLAIARGCDPDYPRNLAKSVTVK